MDGDRVLIVSAHPLFRESITRLLGDESVLDDQKQGGAIMWIPGGMMYALTAVILLARLLDWEERKTRRAIANDMDSLSHVVS